MTGYVKLFGSIVASTIWREDNDTRIVWITMLAMSNKNGVVEASIPGLADLSRVSVEACRSALQKLQSPDPDSRTKDFEGKRIEPVDGGWLILNHAKYRAKMNSDERREYFRVKQAEHRAGVKQLSKNVKECQHGQHNQKQKQKQSTETNTSQDDFSAKETAIRKSGLGPLSFEQHRQTINAIYRREPTARWNYADEQALCELVKREHFEEELKELITFKSATKFFPRSVNSLLSGWEKTLDQSRQNAEEKPKTLLEKEIESQRRNAARL